MSNYSKNIGSSFFVNVSSLAISFVTSIFVARSLGPEGKGLVVFILMIYSLIANHGHLGVLNAVSYFLNRDPKKRSGNLIFSTNVIYVVVLSFFYSLIIGFLYFGGYILSEYASMYIWLGFVYVLFSFLYTLTYHFYVGWDKVYIINNLLFVERLAYLVITLILFFTGNLTIATYFITTALLMVIRVTAALVGTKIPIKIIFNKELVTDQFNYGKYIYLTALFIFLNYRVDQFMINYFLDKSELGLYSIGVQLAELAFLVPASIAAPLLGSLLNINSDGAVDKRKLKTSITIKYTFYFTALVCLIGIAMSPLVTVLYGKEFSRSAGILVILLVGVAFASIGKIAPSFYHSDGKTKTPLLVAFLVSSINIVLNLLLIPKIGITGAALASTVSYGFYGFAYLKLLTKKEGFRYRELLLFSGRDVRFIKKILKNIKRKWQK